MAVIEAVVLDTNVVLYWLAGRVADRIEADRYYVSVITEIELLSYPLLRPEDEKKIRDFLSDIEVVGIDNNIKELAVGIRKQYRLKIPDAVIVATAKSLKAKLVTNDADLAKVTEIEIQPVRLM